MSTTSTGATTGTATATSPLVNHTDQHVETAVSGTDLPTGTMSDRVMVVAGGVAVVRQRREVEAGQPLVAPARVSHRP
jgi:hypothetical protein